MDSAGSITFGGGGDVVEGPRERGGDGGRKGLSERDKWRHHSTLQISTKRSKYSYVHLSNR